MRMKRATFLRGCSFFAAMQAMPQSALAAVADSRLKRALVLSGGGARGAYEVGALAQLVRGAGIRDGEPFPGIDVICGTSIGALTGYFLATAQYSKLFAIWANISRYHFFQLKHQYRAVTRTSSGVLTRVVEAIRLSKGLTTNEDGILDGDHFAAFVQELLQDAKPVVTPFACTATSLTRQSATMFYTLPADFDTSNVQEKRDFLRRISLTAGARIEVREAKDVLLAKALRASATIPILLDPVTIDGPYGPELYIDGGIADNSPVDIARALAQQIWIILVDPLAVQAHRYTDAIDVGLGAFQIVQRRLLDISLRTAAVETQYGGLYPVDIRILQPKHELAIQLLDFDRQEEIEQTMQLGATDAQAGFLKYQLSS